MNFLSFVLFVVAECWGLSYLAAWLGAGNLLLALFGKAVFALWAIRWRMRTLGRVMAQSPARVPGIGATIFGWILLAVPGILTDLAGLSLMIPGLRLLWLPALARMGSRFKLGGIDLRGGFPGGFGQGFPGGTVHEEIGPEEDTGTTSAQAGGARRKPPSGDVVDAEFRVLDD